MHSYGPLVISDWTGLHTVGCYADLHTFLCRLAKAPHRPSHPSNFIAGRPKAALLFWFFGEFRCGVPLFIVIPVIYKYKNR